MKTLAALLFLGLCKTACAESLQEYGELVAYSPPHSALCKRSNPWALGQIRRVEQCLVFSYRLVANDVAILHESEYGWSVLYPSACNELVKFSVVDQDRWVSVPAPKASKQVISNAYFQSLFLLRGTTAHRLPDWPSACDPQNSQSRHSSQVGPPRGLELVPLANILQKNGPQSVLE